MTEVGIELEDICTEIFKDTDEKLIEERKRVLWRLENFPDYVTLSDALKDDSLVKEINDPEYGKKKFDPNKLIQHNKVERSIARINCAVAENRRTDGIKMCVLYTVFLGLSVVGYGGILFVGLHTGGYFNN